MTEIVVREYTSPPVRIGGPDVRILEASLRAVHDADLKVDCTCELRAELEARGHVWLSATPCFLPGRVRDPARGHVKCLTVRYEGVSESGVPSVSWEVGASLLCAGALVAIGLPALGVQAPATAIAQSAAPLAAGTSSAIAVVLAGKAALSLSLAALVVDGVQIVEELHKGSSAAFARSAVLEVPQETCVVCLEEFDVMPLPVSVLKCGHCFHRACFNEWERHCLNSTSFQHLEISPLSFGSWTSCPLCRAPA